MVTPDLIEKVQRLIRRHRQNAFNEDNGEAHVRAIRRLKNTKTFKRMCQDNRDRAQLRQERRLEGMGY
jgi:hypothetical protein